MKRREFIKLSSVAIGSGAFGLLAFDLVKEKRGAPLFNSVFLPDESHSKLLLLSRYILPKDTSSNTAIKAIKRLDKYVNELSPSQKEEILEILDLFSSNALVKAVTYTANDFSSDKDVEAMLNEWKSSFDHLILGHDLHRAYKALTELFYLGFYSLEEGRRIAGL